jgi:hypothetical protein
MSTRCATSGAGTAYNSWAQEFSEAIVDIKKGNKLKGPFLYMKILFYNYLGPFFYMKILLYNYFFLF